MYFVPVVTFHGENELIKYLSYVIKRSTYKIISQVCFYSFLHEQNRFFSSNNLDTKKCDSLHSASFIM